MSESLSRTENASSNLFSEANSLFLIYIVREGKKIKKKENQRVLCKKKIIYI